MGSVQIVIEKVQNGYLVASTGDDGLIQSYVAKNEFDTVGIINEELPKMISRFAVAEKETTPAK